MTNLMNLVGEESNSGHDKESDEGLQPRMLSQ